MATWGRPIQSFPSIGAPVPWKEEVCWNPAATPPPRDEPVLALNFQGAQTQPAGKQSLSCLRIMRIHDHWEFYCSGKMVERISSVVSN